MVGCPRSPRPDPKRNILLSEVDVHARSVIMSLRRLFDLSRNPLTNVVVLLKIFDGHQLNLNTVGIVPAYVKGYVAQASAPLVQGVAPREFAASSGRETMLCRLNLQLSEHCNMGQG